MTAHGLISIFSTVKIAQTVFIRSQFYHNTPSFVGSTFLCIQHVADKYTVFSFCNVFLSFFETSSVVFFKVYYVLFRFKTAK